VDSTDVDLVDMKIVAPEKFDPSIQWMDVGVKRFKKTDEFKRALNISPCLEDV
jgi:hypothetical protein